MSTVHALVLGLGRFGGNLEATRFLLRRGMSVRVADRADAASLADSVRALAGEPGVEWALGREDAALLDGVDLLVVNPGVPPEHPLLAEAERRGIRCSQELELFLDAYPGRVVLVTGTNGKSTTATLLASSLRASGVPALLGGNIGHSLLGEEPRWSAGQTAVVETSSFQLERLGTSRRGVDGAVFTRVTVDHLDRHGSAAAYHRAKARAAALARDFVVHAADDEVAAAFDTPARRRVTATARAPEPGQVGCEGGWLTARLGGDDGPLLHLGAALLPGAFQRENLLVAAAAALLCGAARAPVGLALATQRPLPHRLQLAGTSGGVRFYDNGVSTEVQSTESALTTVPGPLRWVGGGKSKDGDHAGVAAAVAPHVASAHLFGASAAPLARALGRSLPVTVHDGLVDALDAARAAAAPGDAVVFSPAFASFDQYPNFGVRAAEFRRWLASLPGIGGCG